jgi:hypothetical protein
MSKLTQSIANAADRIEGRYDPERDIDPNAPGMNYVEHELLEMVRRLVLEVERMQTLIDAHLDTHR